MALDEWSEAAAVTFLFALALLLESWSAGRARRAIRALMELTPTMARFVCPHDGCIEEKPVAEVAGRRDDSGAARRKDPPRRRRHQR